MRCHRAATLIELLTVVVIISLLMGLLLTGLQSTREAMRQAACTNNMRQISLGIQQYEAARGFFPPGILGVAEAFPYEENYQVPSSQYCWRNYQYTSYLGLTLPYIEGLPLYETLDPVLLDISRTLTGTGVSSFLEMPGALTVSRSWLPAVQCPSDNLSRYGYQSIKVMAAIQPVTFGLKRKDHLAWKNLPELVGGTFAHTNYAGCLGAHSGGKHNDLLLDAFTGLMSSRAKVRASNCTDGLANTITVGETIGSIKDGNRDVVNSWLFGAVARGRSDIPWLENASDKRLLGDSRNAFFVGFGSAHIGGVIVAFGDGHVEITHRDIDWRAWYRKCGLADNSVELSGDVVSAGFSPVTEK